MRGSIQRRGRRSWRIVFDLERDAHGRRRQKVMTCRGTRREADAELARTLATLENGGFIEPHRVTVAEFLAKWLEDVKTRTSGKTWERYSEICRNHLSPALGSLRLLKLTPMHLQSFYAAGLSSGRRNGMGGLSARTVLHHHRVLRQALKQAVRLQLMPANPSDAVDPPRPERQELETLDEPQLAELLSKAEKAGSDLFLPILLAVTTGMRRGEILALRWCDVDFERSRLAVVQSLEETAQGLRAKAPKTKAGRRTISLPSVATDALRKHKAEQAAERLALGLGKDEAGLVCSRDGRPRSPRAFTKEFERFVRKSGAPETTFHGLRHSHATSLLRAGVHPKVAQERLGHSTVAITLDLYSHVTESMQDDAALRVDRALRHAMSDKRGTERA